MRVLALYPDGGYERFVVSNNYPKTSRIYFNPQLMARANKKCELYISLNQQRARLYVDNKVAGDWPVSTGTSSNPTPTGSYKVVEKKRDHASTLWGRLYDANGKCIDSNANSRTMKVPEGGKFVGSAMPYWQRLTWDGIGLHIGRVVPGRRLSHGCIRMPREAASKFFDVSRLHKTAVHIIDDVESNYVVEEVRVANLILDNYRKYEADYKKKHGAEEDVELTTEFKEQQKALANKLPNVDTLPELGESTASSRPEMSKDGYRRPASADYQASTPSRYDENDPHSPIVIRH